MLVLRAVDQLSALVKALELLEGLLNGRSHTAGWMRNYQHSCGESGCCGKSCCAGFNI